MYVRDEYIPTLHELAWLNSAEGRNACREMFAGNPADTPTAIKRWRERLDAEWVTAAWTQVLLRKSAAVKFSRADDMLFDRVGLEQSTDEIVAAHKARRFVGARTIADLCCGIGGDCLALAEHAPVVAVDLSGPRVAMAEHNAAAYGRKAEGVISDVELTHPDADAAHIDPDRRPAGHRQHQPEDGSPDLRAVATIVHRYEHVAVKLSPGADFERLPFDHEIELISHHGNCKQAVAWTGRFRQARRTATVLPGDNSLSVKDGDDIAWPPRRRAEPGQWLLEPDPAVIRANLVGVLARQLECQPIDAHIAWLIADTEVASPFTHNFRVIDTVSFNQRKLRPWLAGHDVGSLDIKTRGTAFRPDELARHMRLTGKKHATLLIARLSDGPTAILAERCTPHA